jgi:hypothetical protein
MPVASVMSTRPVIRGFVSAMRSRRVRIAPMDRRGSSSGGRTVGNSLTVTLAQPRVAGI